MTQTISFEAGPDLSAERRVAGANLVVALVALFGGVTVGLLQALEHAGVNLYPALAPVIRSYYHGLTLHGVLNVLVFTTFFICGFVPLIAARALERPLWSARLAWGTFWLMLGGLILAAIPLVGNAASVMFSFYPPLKAHWAFYVGLTVVIVGTWLVTLNLALTLRAWRAGHPGQRTPLPAFMAMITFAMWTIASLGLAAEMLFLLIPWSVGLVRPEWQWDLMWVGIGGTGLFLSALLYFLNVVGTLAWSRGPAPEMPRFAEALSGPDHAPAILDRWRRAPAGAWTRVARKAPAPPPPIPWPCPRPAASPSPPC
jgi:hypothetical protein